MRRTEGFTLVELMIVVSIAAILLGLAISSYSDSLMRGRRADAQSIMIEFAGEAARTLTETSSYASLALPDNTDYYTLSFPSDPTATGYTLLATPKSAQLKDKCGSMALTSTGKKTSTGAGPSCWK